MKRKALPICLTILILCLLTACSGARADLITAPGDLLAAIAKAENGTVIYVGDIDFTPQPGVWGEISRAELKNSVTVQSGYKDRNAVFTCAGFNVAGAKTSGDSLECAFVNVTFDGGVSAAGLTAEDWFIPDGSDGGSVCTEPANARYAFGFGGNVSASFTGCTFQNYMYETGPAMRAFYGDYTGNPELAAILGDFSSCSLTISLKDCTFSGNAALYGGGAIYIDGSDNVTLTAENCEFSRNISGCGEFSEGGGACRLEDVTAEFAECVFSGNEGNHCYDETAEDGQFMADTDRTQGGALFTLQGSLYCYGTAFSDNRASLGGALRVQNTETALDRCKFTGNAASPVALNPEGETGPWSGMGLGGAIYINSDPASPVRIYQCEITDNSAEFGYGSVYAYYSDTYKDIMPLGMGSVDLYACTIKNNVCTTAYNYNAEDLFPWASHPGNILDIEYMQLHGCVFADDVFADDFPMYQKPSADNEYNYIGTPEQAADDGIIAEKIMINRATYDEWYAERDHSRVTEKVRSKWSNPFMWTVFIAMFILAVAVLLFGKKSPEQLKKEEAARKAAAEEGKNSAHTSPKVILTAEEISSLRENVELRQLLTDREMEIMCEYISGSSRSALAEKLFISESTVKTHISSIYSKLGVSGKAELISKLKDL